MRVASSSLSHEVGLGGGMGGSANSSINCIVALLLCGRLGEAAEESVDDGERLK